MRITFLLTFTILSSIFCMGQTVIEVKTKVDNPIGNAMKEIENNGFKYREESRLKEEQRQSKLEKRKKDKALLNEELSTYKLNFKQGNFEQAMIEVNNFIDEHPKEYLGYFFRGETRFELKDYIGTIADCNKGIAIYSNDEVWRFILLRAKAKEKLGDLKGALTDYDKSINIYKYRDTYFFRGILKINLGKNGCSDLKKAEELGHDNAYEMIQKNCK